MLKDLKLFERWHEHGDDIVMTYDELAELVSCDVILIRGSSFFRNLRKIYCFFDILSVNKSVDEAMLRMAIA